MTRARVFALSAVLATAVRMMLENARDTVLAESMTASVYPHLLRSHARWQAARDPDRTGTIFATVATP